MGAVTSLAGWSWRSERPRSSRLEQLAAVAAICTLATVAAISVVEQQAVDREQASTPPGAPNDSRSFDTTSAETLVAGYIGVPYTYPSDIRFDNPAAKTDFTMKRVSWDGKPFKHPLYYGLRVARWAPGNRSGVMVDFLHSKAISRPGEEVQFEGFIDGLPSPPKAKVGSLFKTLEFSHGHNMVMLTGLFRLGVLAPRLSPYAGVGVGVALPHTEVKTWTEPARTYEYQYAGPVGQALIGVEVRLPGSSLFFEYKYTFADYRVPLSRLDGDLLVTDVWRQMQKWWAGETPPGGHASTRLVSHNFVGGAGARFASP